MTRQQRVAVVVGGLSSVGRACVRAFAAGGDAVVCVDADETANEAFCAEVPGGPGGPVVPLTAGVADDARLHAVAEETRRRWGRVDALVNCHFAVEPGSIEDSTVESWQRVVWTNLVGPVLSTKAFLPMLKAAGAAAVVHLGSVDGTLGNPLVPSYSAAKGGLVALTHVMADEFAAYGIRVNCVARAAVQGEVPPGPYGAQLLGATPLGRAAEPDEIAAAIRFLAGPDASYVTGAVLTVDGGRTGITPGTRVVRDGDTS